MLNNNTLLETSSTEKFVFSNKIYDVNELIINERPTSISLDNLLDNPAEPYNSFSENDIIPLLLRVVS